MMSEIPLTLTCPGGGEEWPLTSYKSTVDALVEKVTLRNIHFWCPSNHSFTLATAKKAGMFNKEQVNNILAEGQKVVDQNRGSSKNWVDPGYQTKQIHKEENK